MKLRTIRLLTKEGARNAYRNKLMSFASIATVTAALFILGLMLLVIVNLTTGLDAMRRDLEVRAYLKLFATPFEIEEVSQFIESYKNSGIITEFRFETKEQALENVIKILGNEDLAEGLTLDRFTEGYFIKLKDPAYSDGFIMNLKRLSGIDPDYVEYPEIILDRLTGIMNRTNYVMMFLLAILTLISLLLISNTIKLTVYARRKEIEIMKYVGAINQFIRFPFIIEGIIFGFLGAIISFLLLSQIYGIIQSGFNKLAFSLSLSNLKLIKFDPVAMRIFAVNIIFGVTIGVIGSIISVRKYLNV